MKKMWDWRMNERSVKRKGSSQWEGHGVEKRD